MALRNYDFDTPDEPVVLAFPRQPETVEQRFYRFHRANPHVYIELVRLARELHAQGHPRIGCQMLIEVVRWSHLKTSSDDFKINNSYTPLYARLIMAQERDLDGFFETRERAE